MAAVCSFVVTISKCLHQCGTKRISTYPTNWTARDIFQEFHVPENESKVECLGRIGGVGASGCGEGGVGVDMSTPLEVAWGHSPHIQVL